MRYTMLCCALMASLANVVAMAAPPPAAAVPESRLVKVPSRTFDEFYRLPAIDLTGYRRVMIDAPTVQFREGWLKRMNETRSVARRIEPADAKQIADRMATAMHEAVARALLAHGYEVVPAAAPGVLRLSPTVTDLYVNAPYVPMAGIDIGIVHQDAGEATMRLVVVDAVSGAMLARVVDHDVARTIGGYERATSVSNLFWFEGMFRRWAEDCVSEIRFGAQRQ